ncbi:TPA: hypothetical protein ACUB4V_002993, partial [Enterococcus faecium]
RAERNIKELVIGRIPISNEIVPFKGKILEIFHTSNYIVKEETENEEVVFFIVIVILNILRL